MSTPSTINTTDTDQVLESGPDANLGFSRFHAI
jgi:hypothetical protein